MRRYEDQSAAELVRRFAERVRAERERLQRDGSLPGVLTIAQVALVTGLHLETIRYRVDKGLLPSRQAGHHRQRYVPVEAVEGLCLDYLLEPRWDRLVE